MNATTEAPVTEEFAVWVSTFGLYSNGHLTGYWCPASEAPVTVEEFAEGLRERGHVLTASFAAIAGGELHCFDTENAPIRGECNPAEAREIAEILDAMDQDNTAAFVAVCRDQHAGSAADVARLAVEFGDYFRGYWDNLADYWANYFEEEGLFRNVPEELAYYFDFESYARDSDADLLRTADGVTFVYYRY